MRRCRGIALSLSLALALAAFHAPPVGALEDVGLPIHPKAIPSSITRKSGTGEETRWVIVTFKVNAPYGEVVKYYKQKTGKDIFEVSETVSEQLLNTLILGGKSVKDQINVNITGGPGKKVTEVELSRNAAGK